MSLLTAKTTNAQLQDGSRYVGGCYNGMKHGEGTNTAADGTTTYAGQWKHDKRDGAGVMTFADGRTYDGQWKDGMPDGQGVLTRVDGNTYDGQWKGGAKDGRGVMTYADGATYDGPWKDGKRDGDGVVTFAAANRYVGQSVNDPPTGRPRVVVDWRACLGGSSTKGYTAAAKFPEFQRIQGAQGVEVGGYVLLGSGKRAVLAGAQASGGKRAKH
jgi:hypothetical protein